MPFLLSLPARLAVPFASLLALSAQTATRPPQPAPAPAQQPVFRATANYVRADVVVRDAKGRFVPGLTAADFDVYEDNVKQTIGTFRPYIGGRDVGPTIAAPARGGEGLVLPQRAAPDTSGRIFIVFIDDLSFQGRNTSMVRKVLGMLKDVLQDEDRIGIVSSGFSAIAVDLTHDYGHKQLDAAIAKTMGSGMGSQETINAAQTAEGPAGMRYMTFVALRTANQIIDALATEAGVRKTFIYISEGYDWNPYQDSRLKAEQERYGITRSEDPATADRSIFEKSGNTFAEADLFAALSELIRNANRANVSFYPVDPRGLAAGPDLDEKISFSEYRAHLLTSIGTLKAIADNTGGRCICDTNDFKGGLERMNNETSDYYMIGYNSTNADPTKRRRIIRIVSKKSGLTLSYNTEYTLERKRR